MGGDPKYGVPKMLKLKFIRNATCTIPEGNSTTMSGNVSSSKFGKHDKWIKFPIHFSEIRPDCRYGDPIKGVLKDLVITY